MGQEVIESAKAVVVRKRQAEVALLNKDKDDKLERLEKQMVRLGCHLERHGTRNQ